MDSKAPEDRSVASAEQRVLHKRQGGGTFRFVLPAVGIVTAIWLASQADVGGTEVILVVLTFVALLAALTALMILRQSPRHHLIRHRRLMYAASLSGLLLAMLLAIVLPLIATVTGYQARWLQALFAVLAWIGLTATVAALSVPRWERDQDIRH